MYFFQLRIVLHLNSNLFLIEGVKNGKSGLKVMPSLIVHNEDGTYTDKVREMFEDSK